MAFMLMLLRPLQLVNDWMLWAGRGIATLAIALMVVAILVQVVFRYGLGNALPWPEESAIFLMLWMTGLIAPTAYRRGGFVALEIVTAALSRGAAAILSLFLLTLAGIVLIVGLDMGLGEMTSLAGKFKSASLYYPTTEGWEKMPNSWQIASLVTGLALLLVVNVELMLRAAITLLGGARHLRSMHDEELTVE